MKKQDYKQYLVDLLNRTFLTSEQHREKFLTAIEGKRIFLYGCGNMGVKIANLLTSKNITVEGFADSNSSKHGSTVANLKVFAVEDIVEKYGADSIFLITIFNENFHSGYNKIIDFLNSLGGGGGIVPFSTIAYSFSQELLPYFFHGTPQMLLSDKTKILEVFDWLEDDRSREVYIELARASLLADYQNFSDRDPAPTYFGSEVNIEQPIYCVDAGAYTGDTLQLFLNTHGAEKLGAWYAFEADPINFKELEKYVSTLSEDIRKKVHCYNYAVGSENTTCRFLTDGTASAKVCSEDDTNSIEVKMTRLDAMLANMPVNFIKLDIEGHEEQCLLGAEHIIATQQPTIACSIYHKYNDFYHLPSVIKKLYKRNISYTMRCYMSYCFETVLYT